MKQKIFLKKIQQSGYTIIETMISVSLFIIIIMAGMNALLNANLLHQKSQSMRSILDNLSFVMEDMSRNLRTGYNYHCYIGGGTGGSSDPIPQSLDTGAKSCASGWAISFEAASGSATNSNDQWVYYIDSGKIYKATQGPYNASNFVQLTPDEVVIDPISSFSVLGAESLPGDSQQPMVNIRLVGKITIKNVTTPFSLQTSVSQRLIDI